MKRFISVLLVGMMLMLLAVPCFAADTAKFIVRVVSETNSEVVISVDYDGGASFACYDFELKYNEKKLSVKSAVDGDGYYAFEKNVKSNDGAAMSAINSKSNPIKATMATTEPFKAVKGNDLVKVTFKKLSKDKITSSDISLKFTNCQTADFGNLKTDVKISISASSDTNTTASTVKTTVKTTDKATDKTTDKASDKTTVSGAVDPSKQSETSETVSAQTNENDTPSQGEDVQLPDDVEVNGSDADTEAESTDENTNKQNVNKIIVVAAAALCMIIIIVAVCIYVAKKTKVSSEEQD